MEKKFCGQFAPIPLVSTLQQLNAAAAHCPDAGNVDTQYAYVGIHSSDLMVFIILNAVLYYRKRAHNTIGLGWS